MNLFVNRAVGKDDAADSDSKSEVAAAANDLCNMYGELVKG